MLRPRYWGLPRRKLLDLELRAWREDDCSRNVPCAAVGRPAHAVSFQERVRGASFGFQESFRLEPAAITARRAVIWQPLSVTSPASRLRLRLAQALLFATKQWLNKPAGRSRKLHGPFAGQSAESSWPEKPPRTLTIPSWRETALQPVSQRSRAAKPVSRERRGSHATNRLVLAAASRNNVASRSSRKWCRNKLMSRTSMIGDGCANPANTSVVTISRDQSSAANARRVSWETRWWRSSNMTWAVTPSAAHRRASRNSKVPSPAPSSMRRSGRARK